jgi:hypothetical protein
MVYRDIGQIGRILRSCIEVGGVARIIGNERNGRRDERLRGQQPLEMLLEVILRRH